MWRGSRRAKKVAVEHTKSTRSSVSARTKLLHSKVAQKRLKVRLLKGSLFLLVLVLLVGALSWLSFSSFLSVNKIVVIGNSEIRTNAIQAKMLAATAIPTMLLFSNQNVVFYPKVKLETILRTKFPKIKTIFIKNKILQKQVVVSIVERKPFALWCRGKNEKRSCYYIDKDGFVFQKVQQQNLPTGLIIFEGGISKSRTKVMQTLISPKYFAEVQKFIIALEAIKLKPKVFIFEGNNARINLEPNWELRVALDKNMDAIPTNLEAVLEKENMFPKISYIDMRFDERVYYKFTDKK